ncbi:MAG: ribonucleotide-diphosphate reductase subunit alpha, partial [Candidatus Aenigmarchaeota archaeon]|nr:ribonucleotide-diphosphate reductase subunit alpha [Candidatus Aenigmarchaeota archaeon]
AHDIGYKFHINMQAAFQRHTDNAVSKTINFPSNATYEDVYQAYMLAYELGCKGITVYRDGAIAGQIITVGQKDNAVVLDSNKRKRQKILNGQTAQLKVGTCGKVYVTVNKQGGKIREVFTASDFQEPCVEAWIKYAMKVTSLAASHGATSEEISRAGIGIRCGQIGPNQDKIHSCPDAIAKFIGGKINGDVSKDDTEEKKDDDKHSDESEEAPKYGFCTECSDYAVEYKEGCNTCHSCGHSECA